MFRLWGKIITDNHLMRDTVIEDSSDDTRTHKVMRAVAEICTQFNLMQPIWLQANIGEFAGHAKTRFRADNFAEEIDFDFLEIQVIEE